MVSKRLSNSSRDDGIITPLDVKNGVVAAPANWQRECT